MNILNVFYKQWLRENGIRRIVQLFFLLVLPIVIFLFFIFTKALIVNNPLITVSSIGYVVFVFSTVYSLSYKLESENKIMNGFPVESMPIKSSLVSFTEIIFMFIINLSMVFIILIGSLLILNRVNMQGMMIFSFNNIKNYIIPVFVSLPYTVFTGIVFGTFIGALFEKTTGMFAESFKRFIFIFLFILIYFTLRPYFINLWNSINRGDFNNPVYIYSPINWSLIIGNFIAYKFSIFDLLFSVFFYTLLIILIYMINNLKNINIRMFDFEFVSIQKEISFISPVWNIIIKRWFILPIVVFLFLWIIVFVLQFKFKPFVVLNVLFVYIYTFIALDRLFGEKNDYKNIWLLLPISKKHIEGVFLGTYVFLYLLPVSISMFNIYKFQINTLQINSMGNLFVLLFISSGVLSIIPIIIFFYPYLWASNNKGKKLGRRNVFFYFIFAYIFFSIIGGAISSVLYSPDLRIIVENIIGKIGIYILSIIFYGIFFITLFFNIRALFLIIRSFIIRYDK